MLSAVLGPRPAVRKRLMLSREELHLLLNARMRLYNALPIRILLATGVRGSELYTARWKAVHIEEGRWHIPSSKTGPAMDVPLAPVVVGWFRVLKGYANESEFVLPARSRARVRRSGGDIHVSKDMVCEAIEFWFKCHEPKVRRFTPHDLRSTMKSHMRALGCRATSPRCA